MNSELNQKLSTKLNLPIFLIGCTVIGISIIILIGWKLDYPFIEHALPNFYTSKPITAICILLSGICILFLSNIEIKKRSRYIIAIVSTLIFLIALFALISMVFGLDVSKNADAYSQAFQILLNLFSAGQMPPSTSFCFLLISISFLFKILPISNRIQLPTLFSLSSVICIIGILVLLGYLTEYFFGFHIWNYAGVGIQSPPAFILIGYSLYLLAKKQGEFVWTLDLLTALGFFMGILTLLVISSSFEYSIKRLQLHARQVGITENSLNQLGELQSDFLYYLRIEHVYIITGNESFLNKQPSIKNQLKTDFQMLRQQMSEDPSLLDLLNQIEPLINKRISLIEQSIQIRKIHGMRAATDFLNTQETFELANKIDELFSSIRAEAYKKLKEQLAVEFFKSKKIFQFLPLETFMSLTILFLGLFSLNQRIYERKLALEQKRKLQDQLRQSQKMEAIGQLAGGIAHDFNNLLGIIIGNLDLVEDLVKDNELASKRVKTASNAALRGAEVTKRLLSFSRFDQLNPKTISINDSIKNILTIISRTLGPNIEIIQKLDTSTPTALIDDAEFENVMLNLAVNARDAMPKGGKLIISTEIQALEKEYPLVQAKEVAPGNYVRVTVADTGVGMSPEVIERAFEPFYTTKPMGKGTGLGLAMVYGFAKKSGGYAKIYSELNFGTSIILYLPLTEKAREPRRPAKEVHKLQFEGIALVVDDEPALLDIASIYLKEMGFQVLQAENADKALEIFYNHPNISLLLTDIIMPSKMNGIELSEKIKMKTPTVVVVYASGFHGEVLSEKIGKNSDAKLLRKPYKKEEFIEMIQNAMTSNTSYNL